MASDIVERLQRCSPYSDDGTMNNREANSLLSEAAAELTRLRKRVADLERKLGGAVESVSHAIAEISKITDNEYEGERTRLREVQDHLHGTLYAINPPDESDAAVLALEAERSKA